MWETICNFEKIPLKRSEVSISCPLIDGRQIIDGTIFFRVRQIFLFCPYIFKLNILDLDGFTNNNHIDNLNSCLFIYWLIDLDLLERCFVQPIFFQKCCNRIKFIFSIVNISVVYVYTRNTPFSPAYTLFYDSYVYVYLFFMLKVIMDLCVFTSIIVRCWILQWRRIYVIKPKNDRSLMLTCLL